MPAGKSMISWLLPFYLLSFFPITASGQRLLTLDSCRALGLRNNKQMRIAEVKQDVAKNIRQAARTKYLPHVSAIGTYEHTSREVSILNDSQKQKLSHLGTTMATGIGAIGQSSGISAAMQGNPLGQALEQQMSQTVNTMAGVLNQFGQEVVDAFRTDSRNIWAGSILLTQPLFMGGSIVAANKMADISEDMAYNRAEAQRQATLYNIDKAYWQVVSLNHKKKLAEGYRDLVKKLDNDVNLMIAEGVATRSDGLSVSVKVNEAEMALTQVNDGLVLSKMLLCQLCGLPVNEQITLADENMADLSVGSVNGFGESRHAQGGTGQSPRTEAPAECHRPDPSVNQPDEGREPAAGGPDGWLRHQQPQRAERLRKEIQRLLACGRDASRAHLELGRREIQGARLERCHGHSQPGAGGGPRND